MTFLKKKIFNRHPQFFVSFYWPSFLIKQHLKNNAFIDNNQIHPQFKRFVVCGMLLKISRNSVLGQSATYD